MSLATSSRPILAATPGLRRVYLLGPEGHDVPWGTGAARLDRFLEEARRLGITPACFGLEFSHDWLDSMPEMAACRDFFEGQALRLAE